LALNAIYDKRDNPNLSCGVNCGVSNGVPAPKFTAFNLSSVWAGIKKRNRIIDRNAANEVLRMVLVEAIGAVLKIGGSTCNNLNFKLVEVVTLPALVAKPECPSTSCIRYAL
jgi:hypothetical protein